MQRQFGIEAILQLPDRTIGMGVRRRQDLDAAKSRDVIEGRVAVDRATLEGEIAVRRLDEVAGGPDAAHGIVEEPPYAGFDLVPVARVKLRRRPRGCETATPSGAARAGHRCREGSR